MPGIGQMCEERVALINEMRGILNGADTEARDLTAEERQEYDRRETRVEQLTADIRRHTQLQAIEAEDLRPQATGPSMEQPDPEHQPVLGVNSQEYIAAFTEAMRGGEVQATTLNVGTDGDGGYTVPELWGDLYEGLRESGVIRELATVITTEMGGVLHVPYVAADATAPAITDEEATIADDGEAFNEKQLTAYKYARMTKASEELVQDALFNVAAFVGGRLGFDLGRATNAGYVKGNGTTAPQGLFTGATSAATLASLSAIAANEVVDLHYSVTRPYRANGVWIAADSTIAAIRKIKDSQGQFLWQPALQAGEPDLLLGKPIYSDPDVDALAASKKVLGFGNVQRAYLIRDVLGVTIRFLGERFADTGQVAWRGTLRTSGAIIDQNAFKVVTTPAS